MPEQQQSNSNKLKAIPGITIKSHDSDIQIDRKSPTNATIKTPENLSVAFRWQKNNVGGETSSGVIKPLSETKPNEKIEGVLEIKRLENGTHQVTTEKGTLCTVLLKKQDGEKIEVPINASINKSATENTKIEASEKSEKGPIAPKANIHSSLEKMVMPNKFGDKLKGSPKTESLESQAKKLNLPDVVLEKAKELNLTDLSKVESRVSGDKRYYEICEGNACIPLGQIQIKPESPAQQPQRKAELDLNSIPKGTSVRFTVGKNVSSIEITNPATTSVTDERIGKLSKNADGSMKLDVSPSYSGTITIGNQSKTVVGSNSNTTNLSPTNVANSNEPQIGLNPHEKIPLVRGEPLRNVARVVANGVSSVLHIQGVTEMSDKDAKSYIQQNPDKNVVVIVTALRGCHYCDIYKPQISNIAANVPNSVFIVVPTPTTQNKTAFGETMYPSNFVYQAGRSGNGGSIIAGTSNANNINRALGR